MTAVRRISIYEATLLVGLWMIIVASIECNYGLFDWIGIDYPLFATGGRMLLTARPADIFDLEAQGRYLQAYLPYYGPDKGHPRVGPTPYPAPVFLLYAPFAALSPPVGFVLWAVANFALAATVTRGLAARLGPPSWSMTVALLSYFPLAYGILNGQPVAVLLFALDRAYRDLERGRDLRAGLWAGVLLVKFQYVAFLALVFLAKGRWRTLAGMALAAAVIGLSSLAAFGPDGLVDYLRTVRSMSGFRDVHSMANPVYGISWRGLTSNLLPSRTTEAQGQALTLALSLLTMVALPLVWRGPWAPRSPRFPAQIQATMLVTMLCCIHNHMHGATILLVPSVMLLASGWASPTLHFLIGLGFYAPVSLFTLNCPGHWVALVMIALMASLLAAIVFRDTTIRARELHTEASPPS